MKLNAQENIALLKEMIAMRDSMYRKQLEADLAQTSEELDNCRDEVQMRWLQGQRQYIRKKIGEIDTARGELQNSERVSPPMRKAF